MKKNRTNLKNLYINFLEQELVAALLCCGFEPTEAVKSRNAPLGVEFVFRLTPSLLQTTRRYYSGKLKVEPENFFRVCKKLELKAAQLQQPRILQLPSGEAKK